MTLFTRDENGNYIPVGEDAPVPVTAKEVSPSPEEVPEIPVDKDWADYLAWKNRPATVQQDRPAPVPAVVEEKPDHYVHLANGEVRRVAFDDIPTVAGTNAQFGHWQEGKTVHTVIGVYPAEINVKG